MSSQKTIKGNCEVDTRISMGTREAGHARAGRNLARRAEYREWNQPKRKMNVANNKARGSDSFKPLGTKSRHLTWRNRTLLVSGLALFYISLICPIPTFCNGNVYFVPQNF